MNASTNTNPFNRFEELAALRGFTAGFEGRSAARSFVQHFRWFHRSEHDCPKAGKWMSGWKRAGLYGTFAHGQHFNMTTVYNWCLDNNESVYNFLSWLDAASTAMDECEAACEAAYWEERMAEIESDFANAG